MLQQQARTSSANGQYRRSLKIKHIHMQHSLVGKLYYSIVKSLEQDGTWIINYFSEQVSNMVGMEEEQQMNLMLELHTNLPRVLTSICLDVIIKYLSVEGEMVTLNEIVNKRLLNYANITLDHMADLLGHSYIRIFRDTPHHEILAQGVKDYLIHIGVTPILSDELYSGMLDTYGALCSHREINLREVFQTFLLSNQNGVVLVAREY